MNNLKNLFLAYCSPLSKNRPKIRDLESKLQPAGTPAPTRRIWLRTIVGLIVLAVAVLGIRKGIPILSERVPELLYGLPIEMQLLSVVLVGSPLALGIGYGLYMVFRRFAERRSIEMHLQKIRDVRKLMVYVYGSGALGFTRALEKLSAGKPFDTLAVFAHPPASSESTGHIKDRGAITATAPVQHAMNSLKSAVSARGEESMDYSDAHQKFLMGTGGIKTDVEWSILHLGQGHTSLSCHTAWERDRTSALVGAQPGRYFIVVKDAAANELADQQSDHQDDWLPPSTDSTHEPSTPDTNPTVVRISNGYEEASGVVADQDGLILTCASVVGDNDEIKVSLPDGSNSTATVLVQDEESDVALLRCNEIPRDVTFQIEDSSTLREGDPVTALGCITGPSGAHPQLSVNGGVSQIVSDTPYTFLQTTIPMSKAYLGGPLLTEDNKFAGIITDTYEGFDGISTGAVAVSSNDVFKVLDNNRPAHSSTKDLPGISTTKLGN